MKNMRVRMKLLVSFSILLLLGILMAAVGALGMSSINRADDGLYQYNVLAISAMAEIRDNLQNQRVTTRNAIIHAGDQAYINSLQQSLKELESQMNDAFARYEATITDDAVETAYYDAKRIYQNEYNTMKQNTMSGALSSFEEGLASQEAPEVAALTNEMVEGFTVAMENNDKWAQETVDANTALFVRMLIIVGVIAVASIIIAVLLAAYISGLISKPLGMLTAFMKKAGESGDLRLSAADKENIQKSSQINDEIGQCIGSTAKFVDRLLEVGGALETVANGDLTADLPLLSQDDTMGLSLQKMVANLNNMFAEIHSASAQVSIGSKQIADGAQSLAQGSTEQASAVQQLSASIADIAEKTKENANMATRAASLAQTIMGNAEKGSGQMDQMMEAVKEINQASQNISKVIKVIDDIAFQTNILALNAAVEAARAGQHGKGFAVVAEEVRSLAAKSAEAAKETGGLIANSMEKAELGSQIAGETAQSLSDIVTGINESAKIVGDIAKSSDEQALAIGQVNTGIDQVAQVVQQNSATAEQSAAASQEMNGQSNALEELISQFKLKETGMGHKALPPSSKHIEAPKYSGGNVGNPSDNSGFGKY